MGNHINNLSRNSLNSLSLNILNIFIEFLLYLILASYLGNVEFGKYVFIISLIKILGLPIMVGYPYFILRKASFLNAQKSEKFNILLIKNIFILLIYVSILITFILIFKLLNPVFLIGNFTLFY